MCNNQLDRVLRLVRRTGDRCVVLDNENDSAMVVMNLDEYENMLDMNDDSCSCCGDHCECDESDGIWPSHTEFSDTDLPVDLNDDFESKEDPIHFEPEEVKMEEPPVAEMATDLPTEVLKDFANVGQEESLQDVPAEEADRFYLEPVDE